MFKRLVAVATATMLTIAMSVSAFAVTGVTQAEQSLINSLPAEYQAKATQILSQADLTDAEVATVRNTLKEVKDGMTVEQLKALSDAELTTMANTVLTKLDTIVKKYDIKVSAADIVKFAQAKTEAEVNAIAVTVGNPSGTTSTKPGNTNTPNDTKPGNTGVDFSTTAAVVAGLGLSVAGIAVIAKKKDLVNA